MDALLFQLDYELKRFDAKEKTIESIFIGGGTPSTVSANLYKPLFKAIKPYLKKDIEITSEANPNSATYLWLKGMFDLGVNRISFGVQSFNKKKLKLLNRAHSADDAKKAIFDAKDGQEGFELYKKQYDLKKQQFDIVVSDIKMPNMNGVEMCKKIKEINENQIVVLLTAHDSNEHLKEAINVGVERFVVKPIVDANEFISVYN
jgi:oxygen-independent coproporphyrinogen-3 oxidase